MQGVLVLRVGVSIGGQCLCVRTLRWPGMFHSTSSDHILSLCVSTLHLPGPTSLGNLLGSGVSQACLKLTVTNTGAKPGKEVVSSSGAPTGSAPEGPRACPGHQHIGPRFRLMRTSQSNMLGTPNCPTLSRGFGGAGCSPILRAKLPSVAEHSAAASMLRCYRCVLRSQQSPEMVLKGFGKTRRPIYSHLEGWLRVKCKCTRTHSSYA